MCQSLRTLKTSVLLTIMSTYLNKWVLQMAGCSLWLQDKTNIVIYSISVLQKFQVEIISFIAI